MHAVPVRRLLLLVQVLLSASVTALAQSQRNPEELGVSGYVLTPDGTPVSGGTVTTLSQGARVTSSIGPTGRYRLVPHVSGLHEIFVSVSGLAPYRVKVTVPPSRTLTMPVVRLSPATYFRVRFVSSSGEPIMSPRLLRAFLDAHGRSIAEPPDGRASEQIDADGTVTIGPLPRSVTTLALDSPPLAQTRLPNLQVTGETPLIDGGTVIIEPGSALTVDVVDGAGAPVAGHDVFLEDAAPRSLLAFRPERTDSQGRVIFVRLAAGRYRLRTRAIGPCAVVPVSIERTVSVSGSGTPRTRLVIGGTATFRFTSLLGPVRGSSISASPESTSPPPALPLPGRFDPSSDAGRMFRPFPLRSACLGTTDADGRVTLTNFPAGPARVELRLLNSTWVRRVNVPPQGRELALEIPAGFLPVRVINARNGGRVAGAAITWTAGGARVDATSSASGDALLAGVAAAPGTLAVASQGYQPEEVKLPEPPDVIYEVALTPARATSLQVRVISASGEPLPQAVVELTSEDPLEVGHVAVTDAKGVLWFFDLPPGALRLVAAADGFVTAATRISEDLTGEVVLTLSRGSVR